MEWYRHKQVSAGLIVIFMLMTIFAVVLAILAGDTGARTVVGSVLALLVILGALFSTLTTVVTDEHFIFHFSFGFWRTRIPLSDIRGAAPVRNALWHGLGIHLTPRGWLYNVWGLDAVEIERASGKLLRVGTDEARALADAIGERLKKLTPSH